MIFCVLTVNSNYNYFLRAKIMKNRYCNITCHIILLVNVAALGLLAGCGEKPKLSDFLNPPSEEDIFKEKPLQSSNKIYPNKRKVIEVWNDTIDKHNLSKENIVLIESLLSELGADSIILSKNDQIRMNKSLDRYLQQFGQLFKEFDKNYRALHAPSAGLSGITATSTWSADPATVVPNTPAVLRGGSVEQIACDSR